MNGYQDTLRKKRVLVTGHSGFTGTWASLWLLKMGAVVAGYSLKPATTPSLFADAHLETLMDSNFGDIRSFDGTLNVISKFQPDLVLHLAAQPLVRESYKSPRETFEINVQGTVNVLEACRQTSSVKGILCITTDKVYQNMERGIPFIESDTLGGADPYSASKAAAELAIHGFRKSFPYSGGGGPRIAVARGGNIVGGGDWSEDRLVPDLVRAWESSTTLKIRNPDATRPWQHVLALVEGYFEILSGLLGEDADNFEKAFNLGPRDQEVLSVSQLIDLAYVLGVQPRVEVEASELPESSLLSINSELAHRTFGWEPSWDTKEVLHRTLDWYSRRRQGESVIAICNEQIDDWLDARSSKLKGSKK